MKSLVLFSAGLDSTTVLAMELKLGHDVLALTFDYNQSNSYEIDRAKQLASCWGFPHKVTPIQLERTDARAEIPARNSLFLAKALELALLNDAQRIVYGAEPDATYTDSSPEYISAASEVMKIYGIELAAPIRNWSGKSEVLIKALDLGVPLDLVHSSLTNNIDGACSTSLRFLKAIYQVFPAINPVTLLQIISVSLQQTNQNPFDLRAKKTTALNWGVTTSLTSFKWLPALFRLAHLYESIDELKVYTTGNWGRSLEAANQIVKRIGKLDIEITTELNKLNGNRLNTDGQSAQWGIKQTLSRLPRPRYLKTGLSFRKTQGHLEKAIFDLGYDADQRNGIPLITE